MMNAADTRTETVNSAIKLCYSEIEYVANLGYTSVSANVSKDVLSDVKKHFENLNYKVSVPRFQWFYQKSFGNIFLKISW